MNFTVAIPTYNGAKRLPALLEALQKQTGVDHITWEILVIDNNSQDETAQVIHHYQQHWSSPMPLRSSLEPQQGAAFARQRAMREAQGEWVAFLDDDVWPAPNWLAESDRFSQLHPRMGAFSGKIEGHYEIEPPSGFAQIRQFLAIRDHGNEPCLFQPAKLQLPPAASLVVRRQAWLDHVPPQPKLTGKLPGLLIQGDDYEPLLFLFKQGWEIWYCPTLRVAHQIPAERFERSYLLTLAQGCGLATYSLQCIITPRWKRPFLLVRMVLGNARRLVKHYIHYRQKINHELVAGCYWAFYRGSLLSPFVMFYQRKHKTHRSGAD
ncbi:MAG: hormogonium polysaccharide biosynthesis glycosyltransferase HpsE [Leptolyngbyaceae bacterium]|nr:hormogonium polysaccharide biosynthesis glycosyltransferase HpsE [Leptolyngbyaceae bacterium]